MGNYTVLIGAQWGDEGKGKWADTLASQFHWVARYQGGNNAGHTLYYHGKKVVAHQIPSGALHPTCTLALLSGVVLNPVQLLHEIEEMEALGIEVRSRLLLSDKAAVITPWHPYLDQQSESKAETPIGTTRKGIGPTYADQALRLGLRLGAYIDPHAQQVWVRKMCQQVAGFEDFYRTHTAEWTEFFALSTQLAAWVGPAEFLCRQAAREGKRILLEGAQGTLLDLAHGSYPFVTSSCTLAAGAAVSLGIDPREISQIYGIGKAYLTRVGAGPFPTELQDTQGEWLRTKGQEFGATTGRPRRCGWFDAVAMRYAQEINGFDGIYLNKLDILSGLDEVKIAVAYSHPTLGRLETYPPDPQVLSQVSPIYVSYPGWQETLESCDSFESLPLATQRFLKAIETTSGVHITAIGVGPQPEHRIFF